MVELGISATTELETVGAPVFVGVEVPPTFGTAVHALSTSVAIAIDLLTDYPRRVNVGEQLFGVQPKKYSP